MSRLRFWDIFLLLPSWFDKLTTNGGATHLELRDILAYGGSVPPATGTRREQERTPHQNTKSPPMCIERAFFVP
ncbi:MAG: hypothetical protein EAZ30_13930 [Betaproteobacteria bacterium]|nr:MAG: hypothetical protein EAZ30_13930 [Betaproteobacteria bacterium]